MAQHRATKPSAAHERSQPAEPTWRRPPAKPRRRMHKRQSAAPQVQVNPERPSPAPQLKLAVSREARASLGRFLRAFLGVGLFAALVMVTQLPQFSVFAGSTQIGDAERLTPEEIYTRSAIDGRNIFTVRSAEVADRVAELPGIAEATVHVRLPNQVIIDVKELVPLVAWQSITTTVWLDAQGNEVPPVGAPPPLQLSDRTGGSLADSRREWPVLLPSLVALHAARPELREVSWGESEGLFFLTAEGWQVWLGNAGPIAAKLALLDASVQQFAQADIRPAVIDLRHGEQQAFWW